MFIDYANTSRSPRRSYHSARVLASIVATLLVCYGITHGFHQSSNNFRYYYHSASVLFRNITSSIHFILHPPTTPPTINFLTQDKNTGTMLVASGYTLETDVVPKDKLHNVTTALKDKGFSFNKHVSTSRPEEFYFTINGGNQSSSLIQARRLLNHFHIKSSIFIAR